MRLNSDAPLAARSASICLQNPTALLSRTSTHPRHQQTAESSITSMPPAAKRQRTKAITYPCHTCLEDRTTGLFPDVNPTSTCDHLINTCKRCLKQWIESQIEITVFTPHIQCPQCDEKMNSSDVEEAIPKKMFAKYVPRFSIIFLFFKC
jgi:hypothetical protein